MSASQRTSVVSLSKYLKTLAAELLSTRVQDSEVNDHLKDVYTESLDKIKSIRKEVNRVLDLAEKEC